MARDDSPLGRDRLRAFAVGIGIAGLVLAALLLPSFGARAPGADLGDLDGDGGFDVEPRQPDGEPPDGGIDLGSLPVDLLEAIADLSVDLLEWLLKLFDPQPPDEPPRPSGYRVVLLDEPTPGREVRVLVLEDGQPAEGVRVFFNGESIGRTDERGIVRGTVPYARELRITIVPPADGSATAGIEANRGSWPGTATGIGTDRRSRPRTAARGKADREGWPGMAATAPVGAVPSGSGPAAADDRRPARPRWPAAGRSASHSTRSARTVQQIDDGNRTIRLGNVNVTVQGAIEPGAAVTIVATVRGNPVPGIYVAVDDQRVGRTDDAGRLAVTLPRTQRTTVTVSRGDLHAERTLTLANLSVAVRGPFGLVLPGQPATVAVTEDGEPLDGATVAVAGNRAGTTGSDGTLDVGIPVRPVATVTVTTPDEVTVTRTTLPALPVVVALVLAAVLARGGLAVRRRAAAAEQSWPAAVADAVEAALSRALSALVAAATRIEASFGRLRVRLGRLLRRLRARLAGQLLAGLSPAEALRALLRQPWELLRQFRAWLAGLLPGIGTASTADAGDHATGAGAGAGAGAADAATDEQVIRAAFRELLARIPVGDYRTKTAAELARLAVEAGLPADAVETLAEAFREVEYGGRSVGTWRDRVERAVRAVRSAEGTDADGGGEP